MEYHFAKTNELSEKEFDGILSLFNTIFSRSLTPDELKSQYTSTEFGYSYHSFLVVDGIVIAHHAAFPSKYIVNGQEALTYYTGSTMVDVNYRDGFCFLEIVKKLTTNMKQLGFAFVFGFPNELSYKVFGRLKMCKDIGRLKIYCLPYRIGGIKKSYTVFNVLSKSFCTVWAWLHHFGGKKEIKTAIIHKNDDVYNLTRYNRLESKYHHVKIDSTEFYYCIKLHENVRTAFLIDVKEKSEYNFRKAVWGLLDLSIFPNVLSLNIFMLPESF